MGQEAAALTNLLWRVLGSSCFIRCFRLIDLISRSTTGCQLSFQSQRRQRGKQERNSDVLIKPEGWTPKEDDMVIPSKQRDQGEQDAGDQRDPAADLSERAQQSLIDFMRPYPEPNQRVVLQHTYSTPVEIDTG